ncbi:MAG TPA: N-acetylmuramic acid 6-phosphate etherase [Candidatus Baltobacteraceae bacterium]|jgi:N-acetylmuramic acid 6-phosphate etherase|nr:N-acetylmuramic acid 6-phosphate etherase [Candidatus Baltobacteraceae bacterium]
MTASFASTEASDPRGHDLDLLTTSALIDRLLIHQQHALAAVECARVAIGRASEVLAESLRNGGTLHYIGAGTSGRLGVLDAAELPPTFGFDPRRARAYIAGGARALTRAVEGAEDVGPAGAQVIREAARAGDVLIAISASGRTPFVLAAVDEARLLNVQTIALTSDAASPLAARAELAIVTETGAEAIAGSTRMGAGTAQKVVLSLLSTAAMIQLGYVYQDAMVDLRATNAKLRLRAVRLVRRFTDLDEPAAAALLARADGQVKLAIAMELRGLGVDAARAELQRAGGRLRAVLDRSCAE